MLRLYVTYLDIKAVLVLILMHLNLAMVKDQMRSTVIHITALGKIHPARGMLVSALASNKTYIIPDK